MACRLSVGTSAGAVVGAGVAAVSGGAVSAGFAAGSAAGLAAAWTSMSPEERQNVKDQLEVMRQKLAELSAGSLDRLPATFLDDVLRVLPVSPKLIAAGGVAGGVVGGCAVAYMAPKMAAGLVAQASELVETTLQLFESGSPACLMLGACCLMTAFQARMCYNLWSFVEASGDSEKLAKLCDFDLASLKDDFQKLMKWWDENKKSLDIDDLQTFMSMSDELARKIKLGRRALEITRDRLAADSRKSEVIQASSFVALLGFGGACVLAARAGQLAGTAIAGVVAAGAGVALSKWYIDHVGSVIEQLNGVYEELSGLAQAVMRCAENVQLKIQQVESPQQQQPSFAVRRNQPKSTFPGQGHTLGK